MISAEKFPSIKQNFLELWTRISREDERWKIYEKGKLLCLKSPIDCPKLQLCWDIETPEDLNEAFNFFDHKNFSSLENADQPLNFSFKYSFKTSIVEMALLETDYQSLTPTASFRVSPVAHLEELESWACLCEINLGMKYPDIMDFIRPAWLYAGSTCLIAKHGDKAMGTADFFIDGEGLGLISSVGVLEAFRRNGAGSTLMDRAITSIFKKKGKRVALYALEAAVPFYQKIGFRETQKWNFYFINPGVKNDPFS